MSAGLSHNEWTSHFSTDERDRLLHDDLKAGVSVSLVLAAVVTLGTLLMLGTVIYTL